MRRFLVLLLAGFGVVIILLSLLGQTTAPEPPSRYEIVAPEANSYAPVVLIDSKSGKTWAMRIFSDTIRNPIDSMVDRVDTYYYWDDLLKGPELIARLKNK